MPSECHAHLIMDGINLTEALAAHHEKPLEYMIRERLEKYRDAKIGFIRDGGDAYGVSTLAAKIAPEYGIDYRTPCFAVYPAGGYGKGVGLAYIEFTDYLQLIKKAKAEGADFIKLMLSGILDFHHFGKLDGHTLTLEEMKKLTKAAHDEGFSVMAHVNGSSSVRNALLAEVDSIEHGYYMDDDCLNLLADSDCVWVPTLAPLVNLLSSGKSHSCNHSHDSGSQREDSSCSCHSHEEPANDFMESPCAGCTSCMEDAKPNPLFSRIELSKMVTLQCQNIRKAARLGAKIATGSDAGAHNVFHAEGCKQEHQYLRSLFEDKKQADSALYFGEQWISQLFLRR